MERQTTPHDAVVLRPTGPFGLLEAFQLERQLFAARDREVFIDFSAVEDATDVSLIVLSDVCRLAGPRLHLAGVANPHRRVLEEFGVAVGELPAQH
jgi:anti-anti-sigma regulatory factor